MQCRLPSDSSRSDASSSWPDHSTLTAVMFRPRMIHHSATCWVSMTGAQLMRQGGEATMKRIVVLIAVAAVGLFGSANAQNQWPDPASNALGQLRNATSGSQGTGPTFDGGRTPTDATPSGGATVPDVQPSSTTARS